MSKSAYIYNSGLGCGCGCSKPTPGLGESPASDSSSTTNQQTSKDLIKTAREYINHEIPLRYKAGAILLGTGFLWVRSRKRR
jgi:hypothetical protein